MHSSYRLSFLFLLIVLASSCSSRKFSKNNKQIEK
ncbi:MAG: hemagglutinin, partial [Pedobacter sp.]